MFFENVFALWLFLTLPTLLLGLSIWGWKVKKEAAILFHLDIFSLKKKYIEKYVMVGILLALLFMVLALPKVAFSVSLTAERTGEIALLVDVSSSMAAEPSIYSANRLERVKPILNKIVDSVDELEQVKIALFGFTNIARSHVYFVSKEDYSYLKESINKVLDINSTPSRDTSFGQAIIDVANNFSEDAPMKIIVLFSDGEPFYWSTQGMTYDERKSIEKAMARAAADGIKIITVGIGEPNGTKIPIYYSDGTFSGKYEQLLGKDYVSYLEESTLQEIASRTNGKYFNENDQSQLIQCIRDSLVTVDADENNEEVRVYRSIAHWFLLVALPVWAVFASRHLIG